MRNEFHTMIQSPEGIITIFCAVMLGLCTGILFMALWEKL